MHPSYMLYFSKNIFVVVPQTKLHLEQIWGLILLWTKNNKKNTYQENNRNQESALVKLPSAKTRKLTNSNSQSIFSENKTKVQGENLKNEVMSRYTGILFQLSNPKNPVFYSTEEMTRKKNLILSWPAKKHNATDLNGIFYGHNFNQWLLIDGNC